MADHRAGAVLHLARNALGVGGIQGDADIAVVGRGMGDYCPFGRRPGVNRMGGADRLTDRDVPVNDGSATDGDEGEENIAVAFIAEQFTNKGDDFAIDLLTHT